MLMNLILLISNVSVASVAKASTLSTPYKMFFLSIYRPPSSFVVSMSVLHKQRAKVVVLTGLPRHSTIAPRGIKINVLNVKTLFYLTSFILQTITLNKLITKLMNSEFICPYKMLSHHQKSKIKQYESINESVRCIDNSPEKIAKLLLALCGDVESNPGPELHELTMATLNTRGLKNKNKLTQLINRIQKSHNPTSNLIFALQETHAEFNDIKYKWKRNHIFTSGCGSRGGLITLLSDNITVSEQYDIDMRRKSLW